MQEQLVYTDLEDKEKNIKFISDKYTEERAKLKVLEEAAELSEVLLKSITKPDRDKPSLNKVIEECGDLLARIEILAHKLNIKQEINIRKTKKTKQIIEWLNTVK